MIKACSKYFSLLFINLTIVVVLTHATILLGFSRGMNTPPSDMFTPASDASRLW